MQLDSSHRAADRGPALERPAQGARFRILVVGVHYAPETIGAGKYTGEMCEWLAARGHRVRVITAPPHYPAWQLSSHYRFPSFRRESRRDVEVLRCPVWVPGEPRGAARMLHLASFAASSAIGLVRSLFWRPQLVIAVAPTLAAAPAARIYARITGAKAWLHVQNFEADTAIEPTDTGWPPSLQLAHAFRRLLLRGFDVVSTVSHRMRERLHRKGVPDRRLVVLPNWADIDTVQPLSAPSPYRRELGIPEDAVVALFSGHMGRKQGLDLLAKAAHVLAEEPNLYFVFGGEGPARGALEAECRRLRNVRMLGLQPAARLNEWLGLADIHLLPQRADVADPVMPFRLATVLASGSPVIATAHLGSGVAEAVVGCGIVTPPGDTKAFVDALRRLAGDHGLRNRLGAAAREQAETRLGRDAILSRWERTIAHMLDGRPA